MTSLMTMTIGTRTQQPCETANLPPVVDTSSMKDTTPPPPPRCCCCSHSRRRRPLVLLGCLVAASTTTTTTTRIPTASAFTAARLSPQRSEGQQRSTIPILNTDYRDFVLEGPSIETRKTVWGRSDDDDDDEEEESVLLLPRSLRRKWKGPDFQRATTQLVHGFEDTFLPNGEELSLFSSSNTDNSNNNPNDNDDDDQKDDELPTCRVVALADAKLPTPSEAVLPKELFQTPHMLRRLDDIYHAAAHDETRLLKYMDSSNNNNNDSLQTSPKEEQELVSVTRNSLEDAGFALMSRRDLDLCEALNAGYLLRLSIVPEVSDLDPGIAQEFYPERFGENGEPIHPEELLFGGRVLVYRRGYSQEVSKGRLLLPKIDYLQASLVQRSAAWLKLKLDQVEEAASIKAGKLSRKVAAGSLRAARSLVDRVPSQRATRFLRSRLPKQSSDAAATEMLPPMASTTNNFFKLSRYGGSKTLFVGSPNPMDALAPFEICQQSGTGRYCAPCPMAREKYLSGLNGCEECDTDFDPCAKATAPDALKCPYDVGTSLGPDLKRPPMQLLERVTIGNLVNLFSRDGRRKLFRTLVSKSQLVEPTYEEVVVVWRPLPKEETPPRMPAPPKLVYELADMFDFVEKLPPKPPAEEPKKSPQPLEIRTFEGVPMANLPAVMPKTKLVFRPADAFVFDFVSIVSFLLVIGSQRFDSPKLDLLAVVSVSLWLLRTVLRYSNKLARYDLLVKTFLTSKISHRNAGALKYVATQAGSQRATRAALVHSWLCRRMKHRAVHNNTRTSHACNTRTQLVREGSAQVNTLLTSSSSNNNNDLDHEIPIQVDAALNDLEDLQLVKFAKEGQDSQQQLVQVVENSDRVVQRLKLAWDKIFEGRMSIEDLAGRRTRDVEETSSSL